ncbi:MAG: polysaccharide biosynthesis/export family protein [Phycisphaerales bacterium]
MSRHSSGRRMLPLMLLAAMATSVLSGCNVDSYMNPSVTGYWEKYPTSMPILTRLDAIEPGDEDWANATQVSAEDLIPNRLEYRLVPGDFVTIQVYGLYTPRQWASRTSRIDATGNVRVPELGDVIAAGRSADELQSQLEKLYGAIITRPQVDVEIAESGGFQYIVDGAVAGVGLYNLREANLRLLEAMALAGGVPQAVKTIYVIRSADLDPSVRPSYDRNRQETTGRPEPTAGDGNDVVDDLLEGFDGRPSPGAMGQVDLGRPIPGRNTVSPGVLRQDGEPAIDIDDLDGVQRRGSNMIDLDRPGDGRVGAWRWDQRTNTWLPVDGTTSGGGAIPATPGSAPMMVERIIEIPVDRLVGGDSRFNIVVRPDDRIFLKPPDTGVVYIGGQVNRPGPYNLPTNGDLMTLSRLIVSAGGLGQIAIPERVDITRVIGEYREATIRVNLKAIRNRTEPDILLRPDDHINIGTNFWATPLAVIRSGFRSSYGFGFLLDRNFGNDVFGAPPSNQFGN